VPVEGADDIIRVVRVVMEAGGAGWEPYVQHVGRGERVWAPPAVVVAPASEKARRAMLEQVVCLTGAKVGGEDQKHACMIVDGGAGTGKTTLLAASALGVHVCTRGEVVCAMASKVPVGDANIPVPGEGLKRVWTAPHAHAPQPLDVLALRAAAAAVKIPAEVWRGDCEAWYAARERVPVLLFLDEVQEMFRPDGVAEHATRWMTELMDVIQTCSPSLGVVIAGSSAQLTPLTCGDFLSVPTEFPSYAPKHWHLNTTKTHRTTLSNRWTMGGFVELLRAQRRLRNRAAADALAAYDAALDSKSPDRTTEIAAATAALVRVYLAMRGSPRMLLEPTVPNIDSAAAAIHDSMCRVAISEHASHRVFTVPDPFDIDMTALAVPRRAVFVDDGVLSKDTAVALANVGLLFLVDSSCDFVAFPHPSYAVEAWGRIAACDAMSYGLHEPYRAALRAIGRSEWWAHGLVRAGPAGAVVEDGEYGVAELAKLLEEMGVTDDARLQAYRIHRALSRLSHASPAIAPPASSSTSSSSSASRAEGADNTL
jgi:hypothetical protein